jgi:hypothetical protein
MRKLPLGVAISAVVHAAAVAWATTHLLPRRPPAAPAPLSLIEIVAVEPPRAEPVPLDVALVQDPPVPTFDARARPPVPVLHPTSRPAPSAGTAAAPSGEAIVAPGAGSAAETAPRSPQPPGGLMAMRHGELPRAVLPIGRWDDLDHAPRGTAPEKSAATGILQDSGGGTHRSDQGVFVGEVNRDGTVKITDSANLNVHVALPSPRAVGNGLSRWYDSDKGAHGTDGDTAMSKQLQVSSGAITDKPDPDKGNAGDRTPTVVVPVLAGGFDVTDWLMRSHGADPYASKKLAFLDATRDERVQIGNRHRADQLAHASQLMQHNLDALSAAHLAPAARKRALFELWDECAEAGDARLVAAGQAARRLVIGFIRGHLPAGSAEAFTPDEIAGLARGQQSRAVFQPYE